MDFDLARFCEQLDSEGDRARKAMQFAIDSIPSSLPALPVLYAKHRSTDSPALQSWTFATICRYKTLAIPFMLDLLGTSDPRSQCDAIDFFLNGSRPSVRVSYPYLPDRLAARPQWGEHYLAVVEALKATVRDSVLEVRTRAAWALDDIGEAPDGIVQLLIEGLRSADPVTCFNAACSLGRLEAAAAKALPALRKLVEARSGTDGRVIRPALAAQIAIRRIEDTEPGVGADSR